MSKDVIFTPSLWLSDGSTRAPRALGDEVGFPIDETADLFALIRRDEIVFLGVKAVDKFVIAAHDERDIVQQIDHQRRARHREKKCWLIAAVDHAMAGIKRHGEQTAFLPFEVHFAFVIAG